MPIKFSALPASSALDGSEVVAVSQVVGGVLTSVKTTTAAIAALSGGGSSGAAPPYTDPAYRWFGPSGVSVAAHGASTITGDPFIVWDGSQYIMYYFTVVGAAVNCAYKTSPSLEGPWSTETVITSLNNYHKLVLLLDLQGSPVQIGGTYHGYAVKYTGSLTDKEIYHFTATSLTGSWTLGSKVIAKGASGDVDEYNTDAPCAYYDGTTIYMQYMAAPASSLTTYGYAERMRSATATNPDGPFTKDASDVLLPSITSGDWDYGWLGGSQILQRPDGTLMMVYNAGNTRPTAAGTEPNNSASGYAYADTLAGPWTKDPGNPYFTSIGVPSNAIENTNIWKTFLSFDRLQQRWYAFYNTGYAPVNQERITLARDRFYDYFDTDNSGSGYNVVAMTSSLQTVPNSRINVAPGRYRFHAQANLIADSSSGTTPKLNVTFSARLNGTIVRSNVEFVGNYPYENFDSVLDTIVTVPAAGGYLDLAVQVTAGTPAANSWLRRLRISVERL